MFINPGTVIDGKYEVRGTIGSGGMGVVYEAWQAAVERLVALKLLTYAPSDSAEDCQRFAREAMILSRLSHPNIVQFYSYGIWQGYPYIALERLHGKNLQQLLAENSSGLDLNRTLNIAIQIVCALQHAHAEGVFHRDIKPSNVILTNESLDAPEIKLIDFGLAKLTGIDGQQKLTQTGQALGSVMYMSPEQCLGQPVDGRTDIYAVGCLLFHCLTGMPPFMADSGVAMMFQHLNEPIVSSREWNRLTPPAKQVIARCLSKQPQQRYATAAELEADLQFLLAGEGDKIHYAPANSLDGPQSPGAAKRFDRRLAAISIAVVIGITILFAVQHFRTTPPPADTTTGVQPASEGQLNSGDAALISSPTVAYNYAKRLMDNRNHKDAERYFFRANELVDKQSKDASMPAAGKTDVRPAYLIKLMLARNLAALHAYDRAQPFALQAVALSQHLSKQDQAYATGQAAGNLTGLGRAQEALPYAKLSARAWDDALAGYGPIPGGGARRDCALGWMTLAMSFDNIGKRKEAQEAVGTAVMHAQKQDRIPLRLRTLNYMAQLQYYQKQFPQSLATMKRWLADESQVDPLSRDTETLIELSEGYQTLGHVETALGKTAAGQKHLEKAIKYAESITDASGECSVARRYSNLALNFYRTDQVAAGDRAMAQAKSHGEDGCQLETYVLKQIDKERTRASRGASKAK